MSLIAIQRAVGPRPSMRRQLEHLEVAARTRGRSPRRGRPGRWWRGSPTSPKLIANTGTSRARVGAQRGEDRAVAAEHDAQVDVLGGSSPISTPVGRLEAVLAASSGSRHSVDAARAARRRPARAPRPRRVPPRWVDDGRRSRLHRRAARRGPSRAGAARLGEPDERLAVALRAGQPGRREAQHRGAEAARRRRRRRAPARAAPGRAPRRPCRPARGPTSNCGLTIARQSKRSAAHASTAGRTLRSEMKETSMTIRSGAYGSCGGSSARALTRSMHGDARILAQRPVRARRRRRRARSRARRRAAAGSR